MAKWTKGGKLTSGRARCDINVVVTRSIMANVLETRRKLAYKLLVEWSSQLGIISSLSQFIAHVLELTEVDSLLL